MLSILVIGLLIVALMVYASTRIKRTAAKAFDAETIETDEFIIQKADGFLHVINGDPIYAFEAYSKEFGGPGAEEFRKATANVVVVHDSSLDKEAEAIRSSADIKDEVSEVIGDVHYRVIEIKTVEKGVDFRTLSKIAGRDDTVYIFTIRSCAETTDDLARNIEAMLASFELK